MSRPYPRYGIAAILTLTCLSTVPAAAQVSFTARSSTSRIDTQRSDFADATLSIAARTEVGAGSSGSRSIDFLTSPELVSHSAASAGQVILTETGFVPPNEIQANVTAGAGGGSFTITEGFNAGTDPSGYGPLFRYATGFSPFVNTGLPLLELYLPLVGGGLVDNGGSFTIGFSIPGDYSTTNGLASTSGQHYLNYLDPAWNITQDFSYDAGTNRTYFSAVNPSYLYDPSGDPEFDPSPNLDVFFFGSAAAVPEPLTWVSMVLGIGVVGFALRQRRNAAALVLG